MFKLYLGSIPIFYVYKWIKEPNSRCHNLFLGLIWPSVLVAESIDPLHKRLTYGDHLLGPRSWSWDEYYMSQDKNTKIPK